MGVSLGTACRAWVRTAQRPRRPAPQDLCPRFEDVVRPSLRPINGKPFLRFAAVLPVAGAAFCCTQAHASESTLLADTYVTTARPSTNYGALSNLYVNSAGTALLRFDLTAVPTGTTSAQVGRATLRVYVNRVNVPGTLAVSPVSAAWNEEAVTQQTLPPLGNAVDVEAAADEGMFIAFDVTALVKTWIDAPSTNFGFALTATSTDVVLDSKESDTTAHPATLDITLAAGAGTGPVGPQGAKGDKGDTGAQGPAGVAGVGGAQGPAGPSGVPGPKGDAGGLVYRGSYSAVLTYAAEDLVSYAGAAWVSLLAGNAGVTPGTNDSAWGLLVPAAASSGGGGTTTTAASLGYKGVYSSAAVYGTNDVVTFANAAWVSISTGNANNEPDTSPLFWAVLVPAATTTTTGTGTGTGTGTSLGYKGVYASTANYGTNDVVTYASAAWVSLVAGNHGNTPDVSPVDWAVLVPAAATGTGGTPVITRNLAFEGGYISTTNYAMNDVVTWQNTAWISLGDGNHGNAPDTSTTFWATLVPAAVGLTGATGATGAAGVQGPQGERGYIGPTGLQGDTGATGATGRPGFVYQGAYSSVSNYAAGDVALWQGSSYSSLHDSNHGNTPSESPLDWGLLTSTGPKGDTGSTGATGPQGIQGVPGEFGPAGPQGLTGPVGSTGPQGQAGRDGTQGPQGDTGPAGVTGAPGPVGIAFRGSYASGTNYAQNDAVKWQGQTWLSLVNGNVGQTPDASPAYWTLLAAQGATGPQGVQGFTGPQGLQGITGAQGPQGSTGAIGVTGQTGEPGSIFQGAYSSGTNYALHDAVAYAGGTWLSVSANNHGNTPGLTVDWAQMAAPGAAGPQGLAGAQGAVGQQGAAGPQGAAGTQGLAGPAGPQGQPVAFRGAWNGGSAYVTGDAVFYNGSAYIATSAISGTPPGSAAQWSLLAQAGAAGSTGPQGQNGATGQTGASGPIGATGAQGDPGLLWRGDYNSGTNYAARDAVAYNGASYVSLLTGNVGNTPGAVGSTQWALLAAAGVPGPQGTAGSNGAAGMAATVAVDTVTTGAAGTAAAVQNVGTGSAARFSFTIPQGAAGTAGAAGTPGLVYRGTWSNATGYRANDTVFYGGNSYIARVANTTTNPATDVANSGGTWALLAQQGAPGAATVTIGSVATGTTASVTNSGTQSAATLNFVLPQGPQGPAGLTWRSAWDSTVQYAANDAVSYGASSYIAIASSRGTAPVGNNFSSSAWALLAAQGATGSTGATGPTGPTGANGTTPVFTVRQTTTLAAGSSATVTIDNTNSAAPALSFGIPQGAAGTGSGVGTGGATFTTLHTVAANSDNFYGVNSTAASSAAGVTIYTLMPASCSVSSIHSYNTSGTPAVITLWSSTSTSGFASVLSCTTAATGASSCTAQAADVGGKLVYFDIRSQASSVGYVYTTIACQ